MDFIDVFRAFHPKAAEYTYFSRILFSGTFSKIGHMLRHKISLNKFMKIEITSSIFSDHNAVKLEIDHKKNTEKYTKTWKVINMLSNKEWVKNKIKRYLKTNENESTTQNLWDTRKAVPRGKFIALQVYLKEQEKLKYTM